MLVQGVANIASQKAMPTLTWAGKSCTAEVKITIPQGGNAMKKIIALAMALVIITSMAALNPTAKEGLETPDETVFYHTDVAEVVGCEADADIACLWELQDGRYTVRFIDGTESQLSVSDGGWQFI